MVETLEGELAFPFKDGRIMPPPPYFDFVELLNKIRERSPDEVSLISFNYDLGIDYALHFSSITPNYCLSSDVTGFPLLKLHGSVNWVRCSNPTCGEIVPWSLQDFFSKANWQTYRIKDNLSHCNMARSSDPVIVPPTWNKTQHHHEISAVWQNAARHLSEAENIFVIGYSLPDTDQFFRYLFALGTIGDALIKRFWVFDPDQTGTIQNRYAQLLGQTSLKKFQCIPLKFTDAIGYIDHNAGLTS
jgi:hypothetical protein